MPGGNTLDGLIWDKFWIPVPVLKPGCDDISAGNIITDPYNPSDILLKFEKTTPDAGGELKLVLQRDPATMHTYHPEFPTSLNYETKSQRIVTFEPDFWVYKRIKDPKVDQVMQTKPVYLITGVKTGKDINILTQTMKPDSVDEGCVPCSLKEKELPRDSYSSRRFRSDRDVVLAYRLTVVELREHGFHMDAYEVDETTIMRKVAAMMEASCEEEGSGEAA
ncbi:hypothetical protein BO78DRAFT_424297 [Aspergillus sclerotiicarbonarius CBS 121057]|uniref:Uncharacterized protein n=1 Tax=Aspergillus sclerotiicarbonarius (strain CBS 121057 / IBT 28362) TaxID=1448318 RepID=A0A319DT85_ASPSB|nr:hypothetical protein BO78DRAFT_424297 [Aspergillus sclerotiicarbonarius CBS 121057]